MGRIWFARLSNERFWGWTEKKRIRKGGGGLSSYYSLLVGGFLFLLAGGFLVGFLHPLSSHSYEQSVFLFHCTASLTSTRISRNPCPRPRPQFRPENQANPFHAQLQRHDPSVKQNSHSTVSPFPPLCSDAPGLTTVNYVTA